MAGTLIARTWRMSRPVCADCSDSSVLTKALAPASSTKDAAICVTAKMRSRRFVLPVIRTLPLERLIPCEESADGRRGTKASNTAATTASAAPIQSILESTVRSSARTENREAYRAMMSTMGRALSTPRVAPAPQSSRLSASRTRRSAPVVAPSAARIDSSPSRWTVRERIRLATFEQAMTKMSDEAAAEAKDLTDDGRIAHERARPEMIGQDDDTRGLRTVVFRADQAT